MTRRAWGRLTMAFLHAGALLLIVGFSCNWHRIPRSTPRVVAPAAWQESWGSGTSPVALVVNRAATVVDNGSGAPPFSERDWSMGWMNTIAQEVGPVTILDSASLDRGAIDAHQVVVISSGCRHALSADTFRELETWVQAGGVLVIDVPDSLSEHVAGLDAPDPLPIAAPHVGLTTTEGFLPSRDGMSRLPLYTRFLANASVDDHTQVLARLGGSPAITSRQLGSGLVIATLFDFAGFVTATQQGRPEENYEVVSRYPEVLRPRVESNDLMAALEFHDNPVPLADILERALFHHIRAHTLLPGLWYWPDGAPGVYAMTHDDEEYGAKAEWMPADETRRGVPSTCYYIPTSRMDEESLARVAAGGHALGVHWYRTYRRLSGLPMLGPFLVPITLADQVDRLNAALPDSVGPVRHCRLHILEWDDHYTRSFREMAATTIQLDSSYGPDYGCRGYMFGTGYPFRPLDVSGIPFDLHELPYTHSEQEAGTDADYLVDLGRRSVEGDHTAVVSLFHPPFWGFVPSVETYHMWRELPEKMASAGVVPVTMETIRRFVRSRESTSLLVTRTLQGVVIEYEITDREPGHHLMLPQTLGGRSVNVLDGAAHEVTSQGNSHWQLVPLPGASGRIVVEIGR